MMCLRGRPRRCGGFTQNQRQKKPKKGGEPMQKMLFEIVSAIATAAIATFAWWLIGTKRNDHDEEDRDR